MSKESELYAESFKARAEKLKEAFGNLGMTMQDTVLAMKILRGAIQKEELKKTLKGRRKPLVRIIK